MGYQFRTFYFYLGMAILAVWAVYQAWSSQSRTETIHPFKAFCHLLAFYLAYLLIPLVFFSIYAGWIGYYSIHESIFIFVISAVLSYARFIEPHLIRVETTPIKSILNRNSKTGTDCPDCRFTYWSVFRT